MSSIPASDGEIGTVTPAPIPDQFAEFCEQGFVLMEVVFRLGQCNPRANALLVEGARRSIVIAPDLVEGEEFTEQFDQAVKHSAVIQDQLEELLVYTKALEHGKQVEIFNAREQALIAQITTLQRELSEAHARIRRLKGRRDVRSGCVLKM